jgi:AcrR family transcriptional regulator
MNEAVQIPDEIGSDSRPAHILGVAKDEFLANGFAATTMDGIAKAARISKQTLYKHFHDKADLLEAVIIEDMQSFRSLPDLTQDKRDPRAVLVETARWVYDNHVGWASVATP